jgi:hypothetical protein
MTGSLLSKRARREENTSAIDMVSSPTNGAWKLFPWRSSVCSWVITH